MVAYVMGGKGVFCQQQEPYRDDAVGGNDCDMTRDRLIGDGHLVVLGDGAQVAVAAETEGVRLLRLAGKPIGAPMAWYGGPIVMNTRDELRVACEELARGTFSKDRGSEG